MLIFCILIVTVVILFRENYDHPDLHMERHSMPRTVASPVGPTDWNEALDIIVYGSPEQVCFYFLFFQSCFVLTTRQV